MFTFKAPKKSDVMVFDTLGLEYIKKLILLDTPYIHVPCNPLPLYGHPTVWMWMLKHSHQLQWFVKKNTLKASIRATLGQWITLYVAALVVLSQVKIVITFIDNNVLFHRLSKFLPFVETMAIQNGNRLKQDFYEGHQNLTVVKHYMVFGTDDVGRLSAFGHKVGRYHAVGSLVADYFKTFCLDVASGSCWDIAIVSTWQGNVEYTESRKDMLKQTSRMHEMMAAYVKNTQKKVSILMGTHPDVPDFKVAYLGDELSYLKSYYGDSVAYIFSNRQTMSTYQGMYDAHIVVGFMSTAVREAAGWKKKILYCDFSGGDTFTPYSDLFVIRTDCMRVLTKRLDDLWELSQLEYETRYGCDLRALMGGQAWGPATGSLIGAQVAKIIKNEKIITKEMVAENACLDSEVVLNS